MKQITPEVKHSILSHYTSPNNTQTLALILSLHQVNASRQAVESWRKTWDGSVESLKHRGGAGRPRILTKREVTRYIKRPIRDANRSSKCIRYSRVAQSVREKTGKGVSDRTIRRIGKEQLGGRKTRGRKRTAEESK